MRLGMRVGRHVGLIIRLDTICVGGVWLGVKRKLSQRKGV
jgi:hypothetical protein